MENRNITLHAVKKARFISENELGNNENHSEDSFFSQISDNEEVTSYDESDNIDMNSDFISNNNSENGLRGSYSDDNTLEDSSNVYSGLGSYTDGNNDDYAEFKKNLRDWAIRRQIPLSHLDGILEILRKDFNIDLPKSSKAFLHTTEAKYEYGIKLPIDNLKNLSEFEEKLKDNEQFQDDTEEYMRSLIENDKKLSNSARTILKTFLSRDIAIKLTVSRDSKNKFNMTKDLPKLKQCILGAMDRKKEELKLRNLSSLTVLSQCLTRATDWDNSRSHKIDTQTSISRLDQFLKE